MNVTYELKLIEQHIIQLIVHYVVVWQVFVVGIICISCKKGYIWVHANHNHRVPYYTFKKILCPL